MVSDKLAGALERAAAQVKKARRTMHSETHALAKDISEYCDEPRAFALYLGRIKRVGLAAAYQAFSELKERVNQRRIKHMGRWWLWRTKYLTSVDKKRPSVS